MTVLETQGLTRRFGRLTAVDRLTIRVDRGEAFGLLGPNGAGKTTVIKMLTTLLPPTAGSARVAGHDIGSDPAAVRASIGYVPQLLSADGMLTGHENLLIFAKLYDLHGRVRLDRVRDALSLTGLTEAADRLVRTYSGGMIRRLEIAQSMLHRPAVLFLDEPTVGLDPVARKAVWDHIELLQRDYGVTIFLTTHYMEEAERLCQRVAIMNLGQVVSIGSPAELEAGIGGGTLEDVFAHYTGAALQSGGNYRETSRTRRTARRLS
jgi:ABC-2 type transport system ATP-binding protein